MASARQIEANRRNAQRSTGPKTAEGREASRLNGLTHGLRARILDVLPHENAAEFGDRLRAWDSDYQPATEAEGHLVRQAAILSWKIDRADRYEHTSLCGRVLEAVEPCVGGPSLAMERAADLASFDPSPEGERIRRYQFSLHRALLRTLDTLAKLRAKNQNRDGAGAIGANGPNPPQGRAEPGISVPGEQVAATSEANLDDILRDAGSTFPTSKADHAPAVHASFDCAPKRSLTPRSRIELLDPMPVDWLDVSCLKS